MQYFVVNFCNVSACQYHRKDDTCAKNGMNIAKQVSSNTNIQNGNICVVRQQINIHRLQNTLEE